jgi:hypothetical protein
MSGARANGVVHDDGESIVIVPVVAKLLHLAAAPTFAVMALSTVILDGRVSNALCAAAGSPWLSGMAPMYLLMALFHLTPWLKLISRRHLEGESRRDSFRKSRSSWVDQNSGETP